MSYPNGQFPDSALSPICGGGALRNDAAASWNRMAAKIYREEGVKIGPKGDFSSYRTVPMQVTMKAMYGSNAAEPGTSNHGLALAVDTAFDYLINKYGAEFGWQKKWSDASWEPWHFVYAEGYDQHRGEGDPGIDYKSGGHPSWWKRVKGLLAEARAKRDDKKRRRKRANTPERRKDLHKQIAAEKRLIKRLTKRMKESR